VPSILRSVLAVLGGFLTMAIVVMMFTGALKMLLPSWFPADGAPTGSYLIVNVAYSFVAALAGGYVAAKLFAQLPMQHAIALGAFVLVMSIISAMYYKARQPRWYQMLLAVVMPLAVVLGSYIRTRRT